MIEIKDCAFLCRLRATTERSRPGELSDLALCSDCAHVWDTAVRATKAQAVQDAEDQVNTLFESLLFLVANAKPYSLLQNQDRERLKTNLKTIIAGGK